MDATRRHNTAPNFAPILLPQRAKGPGRAKGSTTTSVIGRKRKFAFTKKTKKAKETFIVSHLVKEPKAVNASDEVKNANDMSDAVMDSLFDITLVRHRFDDDAYSKAKRMIRQRRAGKLFSCKGCNIRLEEEEDQDVVGCDAYLEWYHLNSCTSLKTLPKKNSTWFCTDCVTSV